MKRCFYDSKKIEKNNYGRVDVFARSLGIGCRGCWQIGLLRLNKMGVEVSFGKYMEETNEFCSSLVKAQL